MLQNQAKTPKSRNLILHQPCQYQFLLLPNFSHITLEAFVRIESSHFSKTMIFVFTPHTSKSENQAKTAKSWNLAMHQPCQNKFLLLSNFSYITLEAFVKIESIQFSKAMIFAFHPTHHQVTKSSQNTKIMHLAMHQQCQNQFRLLPNFSHFTLEVFVRIESNQFSKTMIFVFHPTHNQVTKSKQTTNIMEIGFAPIMPRSIPFDPKLFPHQFGGICED